MSSSFNNPFYRGASGPSRGGKNPFGNDEYEGKDQLLNNYFDSNAGNWLDQSHNNAGVAQSFQRALESSRLAAAKILPRMGLVGNAEYRGFRTLTTGQQATGDWTHPGGDSLQATNISFADQTTPSVSFDKLKAALSPGSGVSLSGSDHLAGGGADKLGVGQDLGSALSNISSSLASGDVGGVMAGLDKLMGISNAMNPHGGAGGMQQFMELVGELLTVLPPEAAMQNIDLYGMASEVADEYMKSSAIGAVSFNAAKSI